MAQVLKLVSNNAVRHGSKRPIQTFYFSRSNQFTAYGRAVTVEGAVRAAVTKVMAGDFEKADIKDEYGNQLYRIRSTGQQISIRKM